MIDNITGFCGVTASICTSALFAAAENPIMTGLENVSAIAILGMTMYYLLARVNSKLDKLNDTLLEMKSKNDKD